MLALVALKAARGNVVAGVEFATANEKVNVGGGDSGASFSGAKVRLNLLVHIDGLLVLSQAKVTEGSPQLIRLVEGVTLGVELKRIQVIQGDYKNRI